MRSGGILGSRGFSLVEVIVAMGIIAVLAGIVFTALAPAKEKAKEVICVNNLKQIGHAIEMYRQDYGGTGKDEGRFFEMGLPPDPYALVRSKYLKYDAKTKTIDVATCPYMMREYVGNTPFNYSWGVCDETLGSLPTPHAIRCTSMGEGYRDFPEMVKERGGDYPLVVDDWHHQDRVRLEKRRYLITYRLNGSVTSRFVPLDPTPAWKR